MLGWGAGGILAPPLGEWITQKTCDPSITMLDLVAHHIEDFTYLTDFLLLTVSAPEIHGDINSRKPNADSLIRTLNVKKTLI